MSASDYMTGNAPGGASYTAPLVGFQLGQMLADLPNQYMKGRENAQRIAADSKYPNAFDAEGRNRAQQVALQNALPNGLPRLPDGSPDVNALIDKGAKIGGLNYAQPLLQMLLQQQTGAQAMNDLGGPSGGGATPAAPGQGSPNGNISPVRIVTPAAENSSAAGPANVMPKQPRLSSAGADDNGADTVRSIAAELGGPSRDLAKAIPNYARAIGAGPDDPLTPQQVARAKQIIAKNIGARSGDSGEDQNGANAAPFMAGGASGAPGPAAGAAAPAGAPGPGGPAPAAAPGIPGPGGGAPAGARPQGPVPGGPINAPSGATPEWYIGEGNKILANGAKYAGLKNPQLTGLFEKRAQVYFDIAKQMTEQGAKTGNRDPLDFAGQEAELKERAKTGGMAPIEFNAAESRNKEEAERFGKRYEGYARIGQESQAGSQKLNLAKTMLNSPDFYSGPLEPTARLYKQFKSYFGENPSSAVPEEAMNKIVNDLLGEQVRALGSSGVGQVRVAEVNILQKSIASLGISAATNRMLIEMTSRTYKDNMAIAKMAREYKGGHLDPGFDQKVADYYQEHPLFSQQELHDPRLIGPREFNSFGEARAANVPKGEPVKINGKLYKVGDGQ